MVTSISAPNGAAGPGGQESQPEASERVSVKVRGTSFLQGLREAGWALVSPIASPRTALPAFDAVELCVYKRISFFVFFVFFK